MRRRLSVILSLSALTFGACNGDRAAREAVEKQGLTNVVLKPAASGGYAFTAKKGGSDCSGTVRIAAVNLPGFSRSDAEIVSSCSPPPPVCDKDHAATCFDMALDAEKADPAKAADLNQKGCDWGSAGACTNLGVAYAKGTGVTKDLGKAFAAYQRACDGNDPVGCRDLGIALAKGDGGKPDLVASFHADEKACDLKDTEGCAMVGDDYVFGAGTDADPAKARPLLDAACSKQNETGCIDLALLLAKGAGGAEDKPRAKQLLEDRCAAKSPRACAKLAILLVQKMLPDDAAKVGDVADLACSLDSAEGCVEAGLVYERGLGGRTKDDTKARAFYDKACKLGNSAGCFDIALFTKLGRGGGPPDLEAARQDFDKSCQLGFDDACSALKQLPPR
jgi:TPR repeat protein